MLLIAFINSKRLYSAFTVSFSMKGKAMADSRLAPVTGGSTIDHTRNVTKLIVDPHESDSFVIDLNTMRPDPAYAPVEPGKIQELRNLKQEERSKVISNNLRRYAATASNAPPSLGTVSPNLDGGNHIHPTAALPESSVTPPTVRVYFDMPGLATLNYKYHGATVIPGYLVLTTDMRYSGPGEFYPFTSKIAGESDPYIGVMVEGMESIFLIKPPTMQHKFGPYEHCLVPILNEKVLPPELKEGLTADKPVETSPQTDYDKKDVEAAASTGIEDGVL